MNLGVESEVTAIGVAVQRFFAARREQYEQYYRKSDGLLNQVIVFLHS